MAITELSKLNETAKLVAKKEFGNGYTAFITGTKRAIGPFYAITVLTDAVIDTAGCWQGANLPWQSESALPATIDLKAGTTLYGNIPDLELNSGTCIGYSTVMPTFDPS